VKGFWDAWQARKAQKREAVHQNHFSKSMESIPDASLSADIKANIESVRQVLKVFDDLVVRNFTIGPAETGMKAAVLFIDGMVSKESISDFVIKYLASPQNDRIQPSIQELETAHDLRQVIRNILSGNTVMFVAGKSKAYLISTRGWEKRSVEEPHTESVVRGPRDGFTETIGVNSALIRARLKDHHLKLRHLVVGQRTHTDVNVMYIEGLADPGIVNEIIRRIRSINIDGVLESGYIEQFIQDRKWSPFPQIQNTERPDKAVANLLEGKIVILVDGTPFVLIAPAIFAQFYQSPEDYYERFYIATLIRMIRSISMFIALLLPSLYIAFSAFHPEMIPSRLMIAMAAGRSTVPFPAIVEAFIMEVAIEILREASVRLPGPIGPTIGIVGALVIGEAAVTAGLVSPIMVIIVALTTIGSFASPSYSSAISIRMLRFPMMILASMFGLYGIMLFLIVIAIHLSSLKSFGVPYLTPLSPIKLREMRDLLVRAPHDWMIKRPEMFHMEDVTRLERREER
jgi:spore germination protein KA/spore germination protein